MRLAPCSRSRACPSHWSWFTSIRLISRTIFPACRANPAHEPTSPPPPMMLTFIFYAPRSHALRGNALSDALRPDLLLTECRHDLLGDCPDEGFHIGPGGNRHRRRGLQVSWERRRRVEGARRRQRFLVSVAESRVPAQVATLDVKPRVVEAESFLQVQQLA